MNEDTHIQHADESAERRSSRRYDRVVRAIADTPWAVLPATFAVICEIVQRHLSGDLLTADEVEQRIGAGPRSRGQARTVGAVAVLPLQGVIAPRASMVNNVSGPVGTGLDAFTAMLRAAADDPDIGSILLDVNSPGGRVDMVPETAAEIRAARRQKPVWAIANTDAASAAYWLASQADELVVTPSGMVGSIGVFAAHDDISKALEAEGITRTLISAGRFKTEGNPFEPLTEEARAAIQAMVDEFYGMFVADVAKGRRVAAGDVRAGFGEGRMVSAKNAVQAGMADRVDTFDNTVVRMARGGASSRASTSANVTGTRVGIDDVVLSGGLETVSFVAPPRDEPQAVEEVHEPAQAELVEGAERLLARAAVRGLIATDHTQEV